MTAIKGIIYLPKFLNKIILFLEIFHTYWTFYKQLSLLKIHIHITDDLFSQQIFLGAKYIPRTVWL